MAEIKCLVEQLKQLPSPPAEWLQQTHSFMVAANPIEAVTAWSGTIDRDNGAKLQQALQMRNQPALTECNITMDWK